jgi:phospholipase D
MPKKISAKQLKTASSFLKNNSLASALAVFLLGVSAGVAYEETIGIGTWHSFHPTTDIFNVCFTPPSGCGALIAQQVAEAEESIYVQAFDFTSSHIANELIKAKQRGVKVKMLFDRNNKNNANSEMPKLLAAGIEIGIESIPGYAHNKVMIIDHKKVITGSFNFTRGADHKNAENVVLIEDPKIANQYLQNWITRKSRSHPL